MRTVPLTFDREIGGVPAAELAQTYGTPLVAIDLGRFELDVDRFAHAFARRGIPVAYAAKAFLCIALAEQIAATALRLDVCSLGELVTAERGGMPAGRMYFHGCGKTGEELQAIVDGRVAFDVVDHRDELEGLAERARAGGATVDVMLRVNTGIEAHTHEYVRTGGENTKFGFPLATIDAVLARLSELRALRLTGLHAHVGSGIVDRAPLVDNARLLLEVAARARSLGHPIEEVIVGGGMGVAEHPDAPSPLDLDGLAAALAALAGDPSIRLAVEPGRALIAHAGTTLYRIVTVKQQGRRRFVIVDGGMTDNPRPIIYGAHHPLEVMHSHAGGAAEPATLCGRSCENDELGDVLLPRDIRAGDLVALRATGAYTYSMASNYNRFGRPPVVFVRDGTHRRAVRGQRVDDVIAADVT